MTLQELIDQVELAGHAPEDVELTYEGDVDNRWAVYGLGKARVELRTGGHPRVVLS